jgi:hypothetical protein
MIKVKAILQGIASNIQYRRAKAKIQLEDAIARTVELRAKHTAFVYYVKAAIIIVASFAKDLQDSVAFSDSGSMKMQDYAQTDYFAEEYVLTTRDF